MAGYTERPAFLQFFQIIMTLTSLALQAYAFYADQKWNRYLKKVHFQTACFRITSQIDRAVYNNSIARLIEDKDKWKNDIVKGIDTKEKPERDDYGILEYQLFRKSPFERASLGLMALTFIFLTAHLVTACLSSNYEYRTKWAAAVQGVILFFAGFSGVFLAISAYSFDTRYEEMSEKFTECRIFKLCTHNALKKEADFSQYMKENGFTTIQNQNKTRKDVLKMLHPKSVCQEFHMKQLAAFLCCSLAVICLVIICNAMELTTIYDEEDVDEEEKARRQAFHLHGHKKMTKIKHDVSVTSSTTSAQKKVEASLAAGINPITGTTGAQPLTQDQVQRLSTIKDQDVKAVL